MLVGIVSAAVAIGALIMSRRLPPLAYTAVHLIATLFMIMFVTCGYEAVLTVARTAPEYLSRLIYLGVSSIMFFNTILIHAFLNRSKKGPRVAIYSPLSHELSCQFLISSPLEAL